MNVFNFIINKLTPKILTQCSQCKKNIFVKKPIVGIYCCSLSCAMTYISCPEHSLDIVRIID